MGRTCTSLLVLLRYGNRSALKDLKDYYRRTIFRVMNGNNVDLKGPEVIKLHSGVYLSWSFLLIDFIRLHGKGTS